MYPYKVMRTVDTSEHCVRIRTGDVDLNVLVAGDGPAILLLHGFPDSLALWRGVIPLLLEKNYRVIAPDQRGFGRSSAPRHVRNYRIEHIVDDALGLLDSLGVKQAHVVGHDWGAVIAWILAGEHPERVHTLTAVSVGHPRAYANAGMEQKRKGLYTFFFQLRGFAEWVLSRNGFANFRKWVRNYPETDQWIRDLSRPGRLTAGLNWYRANLRRVLFDRHPPCPVPTLGVWSSRDFALAESQMTRSEQYVTASWRYERLEGPSHWVPLEAPERLSELILKFIAANGESSLS
jgi:pimeloyl-ACP methyl ester carboxylesterase